MKLGLVVTTLGRPDPLRRLLASALPQLVPGDSLVVVSQGRHDEIAAVVQAAEAAGTGGAIRQVRSGRGASRGRNAGVLALGPDPARLLLFPNDTTWIPDGVLARLRAARIPAAGALTVIDEHGPKFVLPPEGTPLDRRTVWAVIEMGLLVRRGVFDAVGGFDENLGTGADTPWQAGEATDLLLRLRASGRTTDFTWLPPAIHVGGVSDPRGLSDAERRRKLRAYGRGLGRIATRWHYPLPWRIAFAGAGLLVGFRHRRTHALLDGGWAFLGRLEGLTGRPLGGASTAVTR